MTALFLAPHNDDEALFGAFTIIRERPHVIVVYKSVKQANAGDRVMETHEALKILLGLDPTDVPRWSQWEVPDTYEGSLLERQYWATSDFERVYAPAWEDGGHPQHNAVALLADTLWPGGVTHYMTYVNGGRWSRSHGSIEVEYEPEWIALKLKALACYGSQHALWACAHHFLGDQREWYAE